MTRAQLAGMSGARRPRSLLPLALGLFLAAAGVAAWWAV